MRQVKDTKFKIFKADLRNFKPVSIKINGNINAKYIQILKQVLSKQDLSINLKASCAQILLHRWEQACLRQAKSGYKPIRLQTD